MQILRADKQRNFCSKSNNVVELEELKKPKSWSDAVGKVCFQVMDS